MLKRPQRRRAGQQGRLRRELAYEAIRERILSGEFRPGQALSELALAESFRASRTPVREALMRLEEEGLIEIVPRRGPTVRLLAPQEMYEILLVREALESLAARIAASRISLAQVRQLRTEWEELRDTLSDDLLETIDQKSREFHVVVTEASEHRMIAQLLASIRGRVEVSRRLYLKPTGKVTLERARRSCKEHLQIIDALEARDADEGELLMREHLKGLTTEILGAAQHPSSKGIC